MIEKLRQDFLTNGFILIPQAVSKERCELMSRIACEQLNDPVEPYELEAYLGYPGAPDLYSPEGKTAIRRLRNIYDRHPLWRQWAHDFSLLDYIGSLLGSSELSLTQAHHNCLMTKTPQSSSRTGWHQDIRYWSFERPVLVTAWLSLTDESQENGCIKVIPGSHNKGLNRSQFDEQQFFRDDLSENQAMINDSETIESKSGDLLLFDARLLHSADKNINNEIKLSLVFTYKLPSNKAIENTRSSSMKEIIMHTQTPSPKMSTQEISP